MSLKTAQAVHRRRSIAEDTDWELYEWIEEHPDMSIYELAKSISWSHGRFNAIFGVIVLYIVL